MNQKSINKTKVFMLGVNYDNAGEVLGMVLGEQRVGGGMQVYGAVGPDVGKDVYEKLITIDRPIIVPELDASDSTKQNTVRAQSTDTSYRTHMLGFEAGQLVRILDNESSRYSFLGREEYIGRELTIKHFRYILSEGYVVFNELGDDVKLYMSEKLFELV